VQAQARQPLRDAAAAIATRWALYRRLQETGLLVEVGTGGRTKWNRTGRGLPKTHWLYAACVGGSAPLALIRRAWLPRASPRWAATAGRCVAQTPLASQQSAQGDQRRWGTPQWR